MKKIRINRKRWLRGDDNESKLWDPEVSRGCCLGHLIHQVSKCSWERLKGLTSPENFYEAESYLTGKTENVELSRDNGFSVKAMKINDDDLISDKVRESKLVSLFKKHDFELEFYN